MLSSTAFYCLHGMALRVMDGESLVKLNIGLVVYISCCDKFKLTDTRLYLGTAGSEKECYEREEKDNISCGHGPFFHGG